MMTMRVVAVAGVAATSELRTRMLATRTVLMPKSLDMLDLQTG
jgi:hypothetical protein